MKGAQHLAQRLLSIWGTAQAARAELERMVRRYEAAGLARRVEMGRQAMAMLEETGSR